MKLKIREKKKKEENQGFPWWVSAKGSICQSRRHRFDPWSRRIPHAGRQPLLRTTTVEPVCSGARELELLKPRHLEPVLCNKRSPHDEKPAGHN